MMNSFRYNSPKKLGSKKIIQIDDYLISKRFKPLSNHKVNIDLPKSNVIMYKLEDNSRIAIRPSGTEPKIKFYFSVNSKMGENESWKEVEQKLDTKINKLIETLNL